MKGRDEVIADTNGILKETQVRAKYISLLLRVYYQIFLHFQQETQILFSVDLNNSPTRTFSGHLIKMGLRTFLNVIQHCFNLAAGCTRQTRQCELRLGSPMTNLAAFL